MLKCKNPNISTPSRVSEFMDLCGSALHLYEMAKFKGNAIAVPLFVLNKSQESGDFPGLETNFQIIRFHR